jgi:hypothetical protein
MWQCSRADIATLGFALLDRYSIGFEKRWRSLSLNCAIRGKQRTTGGGPREFLYFFPVGLIYNRGIFGDLFTIAQCLK